MGMEFYKPAFGGSQRSNTARVFMSKATLNFNELATQQWLRGARHVEIGYDRKTETIGVKQVAAKSDRSISVFSSSKKDKNKKISITGFVQFYNLQSLIGYEFSVEVDKDDKCLLLLTRSKKAPVRNYHKKANSDFKPEIPKRRQIGYMCGECGHSDAAWGVTKPNRCPKCRSINFEPVFSKS